MSDVVVLENRIDGNWQMHLHAMAARREDLEHYLASEYPGRKFEYKQDDLRNWRVKSSWPAQGIVVVQFAVTPTDVIRWPLVAWFLDPGKKVSVAMVDAGVAFALATGLDPMCAFIRTMPAQASEGVEVQGIMLLQADWVPNGFLAVGRGGMQMKG